VGPNVYTYNLLIKVLCQNDWFDAESKMLDDMTSKGYHSDEVSYIKNVSAGRDGACVYIVTMLLFTRYVQISGWGRCSWFSTRWCTGYCSQIPSSTQA
jgi:pentatricopeptide repeat protein